MKGDFSRQTFDPKKHYIGVLMQQGRVHMDADWNEQQAIVEHRIETEARDVIGECGAPMEDAGFEISVHADQTLQIGAGRYYIDGILCEAEESVAYDAQPDLPDAPGVLQVLADAKAQTGIVYLDVWKRHVTALDDALIREVALGGPDTATRSKTVWQVKVLPVATARPSAAVIKRLLAQRKAVQEEIATLRQQGASADTIAAAQTKLDEIERRLAKLQAVPLCSDAFPEWDDLVTQGSGTMNARTQPPSGDTKPCELPPSAGYQLLENQLYRVEVHRGGPRSTATFKWSRENGSVVTAIEQFSGNQVTVRSVGPDEVLGFKTGQWVEMVDDSRELAGLPGQLLQITDINRDTRIITLQSAPTPVASNLNPKLRRWDQSDAPATVNGVAMDATWLALEGGIEVQFSDDVFRTGDYWLIPARTATGEIEWPPFAAPNTAPTPQPPLGIQHHFCRLAMVQVDDGGLEVIQDCRIIFPPLASAALHVIDTSWENDDVLDLTTLVRDGLTITLDGSPEPRTVDNATLVVTVELPFEANDPNGSTSHAIIVRGIINVQANVIRWRMDTSTGGSGGRQGGAPGDAPSFASTITRLFRAGGGPSDRAAAARQPTYRLRVRLFGHVIWGDFGRKTRRLYLDGQAFGKPGLAADGQTPRTDLVFPTGNAQRASDFESWCYLGVRPSQDQTLQVTSVAFGFFNPQTNELRPSTAGTINVPPVPAEPVQFPADERNNVITITFNQAISPNGINPMGEPQCIIVERQDDNEFFRDFGDLSIVDETTARYFSRDPRTFQQGMRRLTVQGQESEFGPPVTAEADGTILDGDYDDEPGGNFVLMFLAQ